MSKDIKKALEHCVEWDCGNCPNRDELGSGETVCRGRLLPEVLGYVSDLEAKLAESEKERELDNSFWKQECDSLQKTLVEKDKEIDNLYDRLNSKQKFYEMSLEKDYKEYLSRLDKLEKQCDKDKISFAIAELEKVKKEMDLRPRGVSKGWKNKEYDTLVEEDVYEVIDNQIKQLKGGK